MTDIFKASAGSGKTYNLSKKYIDRLMSSSEDHPYRHILAVTFTNKATSEMKERILSDLKELAEKGDAKAGKLLTGILNDYSAFAVSTIDKFFQKTLKAFSREVGYFAAYQIELDRESLVVEAMDRLLDSLTEDKKGLIEWVKRSVSEQLDEGKKVSIDDTLYNIGKKLKSEEHRKLAETFGIDDADAYSKERLSDIKSECKRVINLYEDTVSSLAKEILSCLSEAGLNPADTSRGWLCAIEKYTDSSFVGTDEKGLSQAFMATAENSEKWLKKADAAKTGLYVSAIGDRLDRFCGLFGESMARKSFNSAKLIREHIFSLGLAGEFYREFDNILKEKNIMCLDEANVVLRNIIDDTDAPFIYEKIGVRFCDFLLDEFQDTSNIQWQNFKPLLAESEASGGYNLIVGDVKQSIYRWRDSDWNLLDSGVAKDLGNVKINLMEDNWRSSEAVLEFNNSFFEFAAEQADKLAPANTGRTITDLYDGLRQNKKAKETQKGSVSFFCCEDQNEKILKQIQSAIERGALQGDIAIIVRKNKTGAQIAEYLIENGVNIISDDSLNLKSSTTVRRLVSLLSCLDNPDDGINSYLARSLGIQYPSEYHSLVDLCEALLRGLAAQYDIIPETLFIEAFMDNLQKWIEVNGNNLRYFLRHWNEKDLYIGTPGNDNAVRILTIHKAKGLQYPFVIFPYAEEVTVYHDDEHWCHLNTEGTGLGSCMEGIYPVRLSGKSAATLFAEDYHREQKMQLVDNLNVFYVAMTRAEKELCIITSSSKEKSMTSILRDFTGSDEYFTGMPYDYSKMERKAGEKVDIFNGGYKSIAAGGRFLPSQEASDFFGQDGLAGPEASGRISGIILHGILEKVKSAKDLRKAVDSMIANGSISTELGQKYFTELQRHIESHKDWFDEKSEIFNETEIFDENGNLFRPDRVIITKDRKVTVIDYKFGDHSEQYKKQVGRYVRLYQSLGYDDVCGIVWYVMTDETEEI